MTISSVDYELCTGCGTCTEVCPMDVFRDRGDGSPEIRYAEDCQCCYLCELRCPADALLVLPERAFVPRPIWGPGVRGQGPGDGDRRGHGDSEIGR